MYRLMLQQILVALLLSYNLFSMVLIHPRIAF